MAHDIKSTKELVYRQFLDKLIGDQKQPEGIVQTDSPIDYIPYEALGTLGFNGIKGLLTGGAKDLTQGAETTAATSLKPNKLQNVLDTGIDELAESQAKNSANPQSKPPVQQPIQSPLQPDPSQQVAQLSPEEQAQQLNNDKFSLLKKKLSGL